MMFKLLTTKLVIKVNMKTRLQKKTIYPCIKAKNMHRKERNMIIIGIPFPMERPKKFLFKRKFQIP